MNIIAIIPARMGSSRFPGKPMAELLGKPMIGHVYERVSENRKLSKVVVATCDKVIFDYIKNIGGTAIMTSKSHERASDRCAEALKTLENDGERFDIVVMVQGDEPMTRPEMISEAIEPMINNEQIQVVNLFAEIKTEKEFKDRNCIKVVCDTNDDAVYFSREPIPTVSIANKNPMRKQVCIIPFRRDFLFKYTQMEPTPLEISESIDMLRVIENGLKVRMVETQYETHAVDTLDDLKRVELLL
jgi:3-deoxy-manno-octulosonate cytidylyltransferase (CMP-KDO synthetase)